jgi:redox-sensitive bicupin YhaK (pirin superfamily)
VIAGELAGVPGAVSNVATDPIYYDLHFDAEATLSVALPAGHNAFVYVYEGRMLAGEGGAATTIERGELALTSHGDSLVLTATGEPGRLILVAGRPLNEPIARYGPFVMNTAEEIRQAFMDYQSGRL